MKKIKYLLYLLLFIIGSSILYDKFRPDILELQNINNSTYDRTKFEKGKHIFIYFSLGCGKCSSLIKKIESNRKYQKNQKIWYVTSHSNVENIKFYCKRIGIKDLSVILIDNHNSIEKIFKLNFVVNYPTICIYDKKMKVREVIENIDENKFFCQIIKINN